MNEISRRHHRSQSEGTSRRRHRNAGLPKIAEENAENVQEPNKYSSSRSKKRRNHEANIEIRNGPDEVGDKVQNKKIKNEKEEKTMLQLNTGNDSIALGVFPLGQSFSPPPKVPKKFFDDESNIRSYHRRPEKINIDELKPREDRRKPHSAKKEAENIFLLNDNIPKVPIRRTRRKVNSPPKQEQKPIKEILVEKPEFTVRAVPKPLIGVEDDNDVLKPVAIKPLTPTGREHFSPSKLDNMVDDYRGRRMGYIPGNEGQYATTHGMRKQSSNDDKEDIFDIVSSSKRRSASTSGGSKKKSSKKDLDEMWVPTKMKKNKNMSIDGVVIEPLLNHVHEDSASPMVTLTGSDVPICMDEIPVDISEFQKHRKHKQEKKKVSQYEPPALKKFDTDSETPTVVYEIPKATIKSRSIKQVDIPCESTTRTRRSRKPQ